MYRSWDGHALAARSTCRSAPEMSSLRDAATAWLHAARATAAESTDATPVGACACIVAAATSSSVIVLVPRTFRSLVDVPREYRRIGAAVVRCGASRSCEC